MGPRRDDDKQNAASDQVAETSQSTAETPQSESPKPSESESQSGEPSESAKDGEKSTDQASTANETTKADEKPKKNTCELADLEVVAKPGSPSFAPDAVPNFYVTITNPTAAECTIDLDKDKLSFEVFTLNNYQRVWGDLDCNEAGASGERKIKAGESAKYSLNSWSAPLVPRTLARRVSPLGRVATCCMPTSVTIPPNRLPLTCSSLGPAAACRLVSTPTFAHRTASYRWPTSVTFMFLGAS